MSTHYFLVCDRCKEYCSFFGISFPCQIYLAPDTVDVILEFLYKHLDHVSEIRIIDEEEWDSLLDKGYTGYQNNK